MAPPRTNSGHHVGVQVRILSVYNGTPPVIRVASSAGELTAEWRGDHQPLAGQEEDVELTLERDPEWGVDIHLGQDGGVQTPTIHGRIEAYDEACMVLRVGEGILLVDPRGEAPLGAHPGAEVRIQAPRLSIWPTGI